MTTNYPAISLVSKLASCAVDTFFDLDGFEIEVGQIYFKSYNIKVFDKH